MKTNSSLLPFTMGAITIAALSLHPPPATAVTNVTVAVPNEWSMLAIPVVLTNNRLETVLPPRKVVCGGTLTVNGPVPPGTTALRLTDANFVVPEVIDDSGLFAHFAFFAVDPIHDIWYNDIGAAACNEAVEFGSGILFFNTGGTSFSITWTGEAAQTISQVVSNHIPAGVSIKSSMSLLAGGIQTDLGLPVLPGDELHKYNVATKKFDRYISDPAGSGLPSDWIGPSSTPGDEPVIGIAEAFFYKTSVARDWLQYDTGPPPRLISPAIQARGALQAGAFQIGAFKMGITGKAGQRYAVQGTSDFSTWTTLATLTNTTGTVEFVDDTNAGVSHRFYRAEVLRP